MNGGPYEEFIVDFMGFFSLFKRFSEFEQMEPSYVIDGTFI